MLNLSYGRIGIKLNILTGLTDTDSNIKPAKIRCVNCTGTRVVKHGKTPIGKPRYRCRGCGKSWTVDNHSDKKPDISAITIEYLRGASYRELVDKYNSSAQRINHKIRDFLLGCPRWEDYLDTLTDSHNCEMIYLCGMKFACSAPGSKNHSMYVAFAIDGLSSMVVAFETGASENSDVWKKLAANLTRRKVKCRTFLSNGSPVVKEAVKKEYPNAINKIFYNRIYREDEIICCLLRLSGRPKLVYDAVRIYSGQLNTNLFDNLAINSGKKLSLYLLEHKEEFYKRVAERLNRRLENRVEGFLTNFEQRFDKFHMLKDDPEPIINGWIAVAMTEITAGGFSILSYYCQNPVNTEFRKFACGDMPKKIDISKNAIAIKNFIIELSARALELPVLINDCKIKPEYCINQLS